MFDSIEELESQVKSFQQNILASNELLENIKQLTDSIRFRQESFERESSSLLQELTSIEQVFKTGLSDLSSDNKGVIEESVRNTAKQINSFNSDVRVLMRDLKATDEAALSDCLDGFAKKLADFSSILNQKQYELVHTADEAKRTVSSSAQEIKHQTDFHIVENKKLCDQLTQSNAESLKSTIESLSSTVASYTQKLSELQINFDKTVDGTSRTVSSSADQITHDLQHYTDENSKLIDRLATSNDESLKRNIAEFSLSLREYTQKLSEIQADTEKASLKINESFISILTKLESGRLTELYGEIQLLKKKSSTHFILGMIGLGAVLILEVLSLFLR